VRAGAIKLLPDMATQNRPCIADLMSGPIQTLIKDENSTPRLALAHALQPLGEILGENATVAMIVPVAMALLQDSDYEVQLAMLEHMAGLCRIIGTRSFDQSLFPHVNALNNAQHWRVRREYIKGLATMLGADVMEGAEPPGAVVV
ncbi:hypothetical protein KIPB_014333, partial [Kipferlia bialata]